ncbi:MAG TPA: endonuclease domain-containing protein [Dehalococcoidia bacterium]|nr:endonuclease domain-containing protein [Dehalococcoidia bacterium]
MGREDQEGDRWRTTPAAWTALRGAARANRHGETLAERVLWKRLRGSRLGVRFRRQHAIGSYIVDFYAASTKLVVEVDGEIHRNQIEAARVRDEYLGTAGLKVLRFTNAEVINQTDTVVSRIQAEL